MSRYEVKMVTIVLLIHTGLLAWSAVRHSPTIDEVGHFSAGLSHWRLNRFDLYNVNPPFVRAVATAPLHFNTTSIEFNGYDVLPRRRTEFGIGARFISTHPNSFLSDFAMARWTCIPFSLLGAVTCFLWARELYGLRAGLMALCLWCFCPNVLAYGSLMTPDAGATAVGVTACYVFRKWLIHRSMGWAAAAGILLGLTLLTKFTWLFLLGLWPAFWLLVRVSSRHAPSNAMRLEVDASDRESQFVTRRVTATFKHRWRDDLGHLSVIVLLAFWVLNNGYLFEHSFQPLGKFQFFSRSLSGLEPGVAAAEGGNRFLGTWLENLPMPVPRNFVQGIDHIKFEYEMGYLSYLRGVKRQGGWWYYYLYAMLVKLPVGTLVLIGVAAWQGVFYRRGHGVPEQRTRSADAQRLAEGMVKQQKESAIPLGTVGAHWFETLYLLAPAVCTLWLVSSQTGFNHHLRYVLPAFPFLFIFASRTALLLTSSSRLAKAVPIICMAWMIISSLNVYPHSLSYFNEVAGGSINGWKHLDNSNIDWGQDMILVKEWVEEHPEARPLFIHPSGYVSAEQMGITTDAASQLSRSSSIGPSSETLFPPGWYIVGLTRLVDPQNPYHPLLQREPDDLIGYSMRVYHVRPVQEDVVADSDSTDAGQE